MKSAISYTRISTKDQSNFSLEGQEKYIREFADKNGYDIIETFKDDGRSAKSFDRPDWINLESFIKKNKDIRFLIVVKYDRFSRNTAEGLNKIEMLERKYGIIIVSVFEQMFIDYNSPFFFKQRADILVNAEFELRVIRDRTRFGMNQAKSNGRYIHKAPFGYINKKDESKKPIIVVDEDKAPIIKNIFNQYLEGVSITNISKQARELGMSLKGKSAIVRILNNSVYAGLIYVEPYRDEDARYVKALHPPIVDEQTWREVQYKLGNIKQPKNILNNEVPLRGVLKCHCGNTLTAGNSKGKSKYYWYYKCQDHPKANISASKIHGQFDEILSSLSLPPSHVEYLIEAARSEMKTQMQERSQSLKQKKIELSAAQTKLDNLEEKYINGLVNNETYMKWHSVYQRNLSALKKQVIELVTDKDEKLQLFESQLPKLTDMKFLYSNATLLQKHLFIKLVFNSGLYYSDGAYRTPQILSIFEPNTLALKKDSPLEVIKEAAICGEIPTCTPSGNTVELLTGFLRLVAGIKVA